MIQEVKRTVASGYLALVVLTVAQLGLGYMVFTAIRDQSLIGIILYLLDSIIVLICWAGLFMYAYVRGTVRPSSNSAAFAASPLGPPS